MTGLEVLVWLQSRTFARLIVVVVSASFLPRDIAHSRELGAHAYYQKDAPEAQHYAMLADIMELLDHS